MVRVFQTLDRKILFWTQALQGNLDAVPYSGRITGHPNKIGKWPSGCRISLLMFPDHLKTTPENTPFESPLYPAAETPAASAVSANDTNVRYLGWREHPIFYTAPCK